MSHPRSVTATAFVIATALGAVASAQTAQTAASPAEHGTAVARAHADVAGKGITGTVDLVEFRRGTTRWVQVTLEARGLTPGLHGVHLHAVGKCEPDFAAAGGHFDPGPASNTDPDANHPFHMGDLPNLAVDETGAGRFVAATTRVTLSDGPLTVFDADGTAIIVHANPDQEITGEPKSGVSGGPRVACGVLDRR
jgi:Cu-Zn family superoxide dismutase